MYGVMTTTPTAWTIVQLLFDEGTTPALQEACVALLQLPQLRTRIAGATEREAEELTAQDFRTVTLQLPPALHRHVLVCATTPMYLDTPCVT